MFVTAGPKLWLRLDGLILFISTIFLFAGEHQKWWIYPVLLFVPDIFMLGYLKSTELGAFFYNVGHSYFLPSLVLYLGWHEHRPLVLALGIIWLGHIGFDRFFGYGLKYGSSFKHTHLGDLSR
jgi:hypothetical protein